MWLQRYLLNYNRQPHRSEGHSRLEDWLAHLPAEGFRALCSWEHFCRLAREPERRKVGGDARIVVGGTVYEVDPGLAGETVVLLWGLYDSDLYVEFEGQRSGPYVPVSGPIPLNRYRSFKKTAADEKADRIRQLADQLGLPIAALTGELLPAYGVTVGGADQLVGGADAGRTVPLDPDAAVLDGMARALRPGGRLALSAFSAYFQVRWLDPDRGSFDADRGVNHERTVIKDESGAEAEVDLWTTCFTPRELRLLVARSGLDLQHLWSVRPGAYGPNPPDLDHEEFLVVARRPD